MWSKIKLLAMGLFAIVFLLMAGYIYLSMGDFFKAKSETSSAITINEIKEIAELATVQYNTSVLISFEESTKIFSDQIEIPGTKIRYLAMAPGKVKAGINLKQLKHFEIIDGKAFIQLPEAEILDYYLNIEELQVWDEKNAVFKKISAEQINFAMKEAQADMLEQAINSGILEEAEMNAKKSIRLFLRAAGIEELHFK